MSPRVRAIVILLLVVSTAAWVLRAPGPQRRRNPVRAGFPTLACSLCAHDRATHARPESRSPVPHGPVPQGPAPQTTSIATGG